MVTVDVITFERLSDALRTVRRPDRLYAVRPRFARALLTGRGGSVHAPWQPVLDLRLRAAPARDDGWGLPDPRRVLVLAEWADDGEPPEAAASARERWRGRFRPLRSHGSMNGADPLGGGFDDRGQGAPGAIFTCGIGSRHTVDFIRQINRVVEELHRRPELLCAFNALGAGRGGAALCTFSCWQDLDAGLGFAYRGSSQHREAIARTRSGYYGAETYFARLRLLASEGTVAGRDPFAATGVRAA